MKKNIIFKNLMKSLLKFFKTLFLHKKIKADKNEVLKRRSICDSCKYLIKDYRFLFFKSKRCSDCGCFIKPKTKLQFEQCPQDKW